MRPCTHTALHGGRAATKPPVCRRAHTAVLSSTLGYTRNSAPRGQVPLVNVLQHNTPSCCCSWRSCPAAPEHQQLHLLLSCCLLLSCSSRPAAALARVCNNCFTSVYTQLPICCAVVQAVRTTSSAVYTCSFPPHSTTQGAARFLTQCYVHHSMPGHSHDIQAQHASQGWQANCWPSCLP